MAIPVGKCVEFLRFIIFIFSQVFMSICNSFGKTAESFSSLKVLGLITETSAWASSVNECYIPDTISVKSVVIEP